MLIYNFRKVPVIILEGGKKKTDKIRKILPKQR